MVYRRNIKLRTYCTSPASIEEHCLPCIEFSYLFFYTDHPWHCGGYTFRNAPVLPRCPAVAVIRSITCVGRSGFEERATSKHQQDEVWWDDWMRAGDALVAAENVRIVVKQVAELLIHEVNKLEGGGGEISTWSTCKVGEIMHRMFRTSLTKRILNPFTLQVKFQNESGIWWLLSSSACSHCGQIMPSSSYEWTVHLNSSGWALSISEIMSYPIVFPRLLRTPFYCSVSFSLCSKGWRGKNCSRIAVFAKNNQFLVPLCSCTSWQSLVSWFELLSVYGLWTSLIVFSNFGHLRKVYIYKTIFG